MNVISVFEDNFVLAIKLSIISFQFDNFTKDYMKLLRKDTFNKLEDFIEI